LWAPGAADFQNLSALNVPTISNEIIFWTQIGSIIAFLVALFVLYHLLVEQKDATIQLQKENISYLKDQLADAKAQSPDVLAQRLTNRVNLLEGELKRLEQDKTATDDQIKAKEAELSAARIKAEELLKEQIKVVVAKINAERTRVEELTKQVLHARAQLKDFLCPYCGAPLVQRAYQSESVEHEGREMDVDHEYVAYECGYEVVDGEVCGQCKTMNTGPVS